MNQEDFLYGSERDIESTCLHVIKKSTSIFIFYLIISITWYEENC